MPPQPPLDRHVTITDTARDIVSGMSDGLTVPFALAAGLSGAIDTSHVILTAGLIQMAAGSIAMGLGCYLTTKNAAEQYNRERLREQRHVRETASAEAGELSHMLQVYGLTVAESQPVVEAFRKRPDVWIDFMMRFELGLEEPDRTQALISAATITGAYIVGGCIPLGPYLLFSVASTASTVSVGVTLLALTLFGYIKGRVTGTPPIRSALRTVLIGGLAAAVAFGIARIIT
jgi:VIT1/CCC1 family predicted Fe2+/Mn2+ transporter